MTIRDLRRKVLNGTLGVDQLTYQQCAALLVHNFPETTPDAPEKKRAILGRLLELEKLTAQDRLRQYIRTFVDDLAALGFGTDDSINGGDAVDTINQHWTDLIVCLEQAEKEICRP